MAATWGQGRAAATDKPAPATLATFGSRVCLLQTFSGEKNSDGISLSAPLFRRRSGTPRSRRVGFLAVFRRASGSPPSLGRRCSRCAAVAFCGQLRPKTALADSLGPTDARVWRGGHGRPRQRVPASRPRCPGRAGRAPRTFPHRTARAYAFGVPSDECYGQVQIVRKIRNRMAHEKGPITFEHEKVKQLFRLLTDREPTAEVRERMISPVSTLPAAARPCGDRAPTGGYEAWAVCAPEAEQLKPLPSRSLAVETVRPASH
jgi:hypothetical protein